MDFLVEGEKEPLWRAFVFDVNAKRVVAYNIFSHKSFVEDCKKAFKELGEDKEGFLNEVKNNLQYYFWSKREWETEINDLEPSAEEKGCKLDVYKQVLINWNAFSEYVWTHREEIESSSNKKNYHSLQEFERIIQN